MLAICGLSHCWASFLRPPNPGIDLLVTGSRPITAHSSPLQTGVWSDLETAAQHRVRDLNPGSGGGHEQLDRRSPKPRCGLECQSTPLVVGRAAALVSIFKSISPSNSSGRSRSLEVRSASRRDCTFGGPIKA